MNADNLFQTLWDGYSAAFGSTSIAAAALSYTAGAMMVVMGFYVIVSGILIVRGSMSWAEGTGRMMKAVLITAVLTPTWYNTYVVEMFVHRVPNEIATVIGGATTQSTVPEVYGQLNAAAEAINAQVNANVGMSLANATKAMSANIATACCYFILLCSFAIAFFAMALVNILVSIGPFLVPFWLFDFTKGISSRWVSKLISLMVLTALVMITTQVTQAQQRTYIMALATSMRAPPPNVPSSMTPSTAYYMPDGMIASPDMANYNANPAPSNMEQMVSALWKITQAFFFGLLLMALMPGIAAYLAGGVAVSMSPFVVNLGRGMLRGR